MTVRDDLFNWLSEQERWQQDLAKRLVDRPQLTGIHYDEAMRMIKGAFGALADRETSPEPTSVALDDLPAGGGSGDVPRLVSFGRLRGVGSAASEYELGFRPNGLTIIYGQNAAGKTTYVRALKRLCRTVDCDVEVRGNVFASDEPREKPTAKVEYSVAGVMQGQQLDLDAPANLALDAISVFDARCAELYVEADNAVAYVPSALLLLARLATTQDQMRGDLAAQAERLMAEAPRFPELSEGTEARLMVDGLSAESDLEAVRSFATLNEEDAARLAELRVVLDSASTRSIRADAEAARADQRRATDLAQHLRELGAHVAEPAIVELRGKAAAAKAAREAVELAAREFGDLPVRGVGSDPWRPLWQAAREFAESSAMTFPPIAGARCPLCLQELSTEAAGRMAHFEGHVKSAVREQARIADEQTAEALAGLAEHHVQACRTPFLEGLRESDGELHRAIEDFLTAVNGRMEKLRGDPSEAKVLPALSDPAQQLEQWGQARGKHADTLLAVDDPEKEKALRRELSELQARDALAARLPDLGKRLRTLARVESLRRAYGALATNRLTVKQRQLSEQVITGALDEKLREELASLRCGLPVDLHPQTRVGETQVGLRLAGARGTPKVSEIASEGEQRALSLAFFLAEVANSEHDGGIIVDDPVSSLDDERREHIAERLVGEAQRRQVIVFTHDLPFLLDLEHEAKEAGVEPLVQHVWRLGEEVGRVDDHPPFKAMKLSARLATLTTQVELWNKQDPPRDFDEAWRRVCDFYARLRIAWERGVEEALFKGVVQRFQRAVKTLALDNVVITDEMKSLVKEGMTRCSGFVHDEPPGTSTKLPDKAALAADVEKLREFVKVTK